MKPTARHYEERRGEERKGKERKGKERKGNKTEIPSPAACGTSVGDVHVINVYALTCTHTHTHTSLLVCQTVQI